MSFKPQFSISPATSKALMSIEADRQAITQLPLTPGLLQSLRESARLQSIHYSTQIEGNRLTEAQVSEVIAGGGNFPGRERDAHEVKNYFKALQFVETEARSQVSLTETLIRTIHGLAYNGVTKATPYRDGQNVIRNSADGRIVYMPPQASDVAILMKEMVHWIRQVVTANEIPIPIIAGLAHYQFATIHPYYDGNGRTARLLTTLILHRHGYGLKGIYALEAYYAKKLDDYYTALTVGDGHNYYESNRATCDLTAFIDYFIAGMAASFSNVRKHAQTESTAGKQDHSGLLRLLSPAQRQSLELFREQSTLSTKVIAIHFKVSTRQASRYCQQWVKEGFLEIANASKRARSYRLAPKYEALFQK